MSIEQDELIIKKLRQFFTRPVVDNAEFNSLIGGAFMMPRAKIIDVKRRLNQEGKIIIKKKKIEIPL